MILGGRDDIADERVFVGLAEPLFVALRLESGGLKSVEVLFEHEPGRAALHSGDHNVSLLFVLFDY